MQAKINRNYLDLPDSKNPSGWADFSLYMGLQQIIFRGIIFMIKG